ncbi:type II toxin-antitoxin system ParD family antitoxin [Neorhizobium sp. JUb45]|uniref:ribbon-helix-helix domain-containing protein n=1 Tax=unclassified Neorhizobium TaxID=2629175 RepID=UPI001050669B|nr:type II toxin-antitoxin system ParD family antitoxin [Neorhizobium sp. JUb45]TCR03152.1 Arc/MetJ-type ribon-helix-helix transcriptional regulator [Neorhizobium sp. JUb45]
MSKMQSITVSLPMDIAEQLHEKVSSGEYATESEAVTEGLRELFAEDPAIQKWIEDDVLPTFDRLQAGTEKTFTVDEVRERLNARMEALVAKHA